MLKQTCTTLLGGDTVANMLLDASGPSSIFDGAATQFADGTLLDVWAGVNTLLGVSPDVSETAILTDITADLGIPVGELPSVGSSAFDSDLVPLATTDFSASSTDFSTWLSSLPGDLGSLGDGASGLGELGIIGTDLTTFLVTSSAA